MIKGLQFRESDHTYTYGGAHVPGVTTVIEDTLDSFSRVPRDVLERSRQLGKAVHKACALHDLKDLNISTVHEAVTPYLNAWIRFCKEQNFMALEIEAQVFHRKHMYAGTTDRVGYVKGCQSAAIIDIKSGLIMPSARIQTAAYQEAYNFRRKEGWAEKRYIVQLKSDGNYHVEECHDKGDFSVFLSALHMHHWRLKNKI